MNRKKSSISRALVQAVVLMLLTQPLSCPNGLAKTYTVEDRQLKLMEEINAAQRANQLTVKEAKKLRKDLADVARDKKSMLAKGKGKLSDDDSAKLESELNDVSNKLLKLQLAKRVTDR